MKTTITIISLSAILVCMSLSAQQVPRPAVAISPGTDIQAVVDKHPAGTAFLLKAGIHRLQSIRPKDNMSFSGEVAADGTLLTTLSGAQLVTRFAREEKLWVIAEQTQPTRRTGVYDGKYHIDEPGWEGLTHCVDVFVDNAFLRHVGGGGLRLSWKGPGIPAHRWGPPTVVIGKDYFFTAPDDNAPQGITSEFFDCTTPLSKIPDLSGKTPERKLVSDSINFIRNGYVWDALVLPSPKGKTSWDEKRYDDRFADTFASRHVGFLKVPKTGEYTFYLSSDDGSRLWLDDILRIDNDGLRSGQDLKKNQSSGIQPTAGFVDDVLHDDPGVGQDQKKKQSSTIPLTAGFHKIRIEHFKNKSLDNVASGTYYFDYAADRIYLADDPAGKTVEVSFVKHAFDGSGWSGVTNVTVRNLIIEKYANGDAMGAIMAGPGWIIEGNETRLNHGTGIEFNARNETGPSGGIVRHNYSHHNGSRGIGIQYGRSILIESNEVAFNNRLHYGRGWNAAGIKNSFGDRCTIRGNHIHDNDAKGIWIDCEANENVIEGNQIVRNASSGITVEISIQNIVRNNRIGSNNLKPSYDHAEVYIQSCGKNEVYGNQIEVAPAGDNGVLLALGDRRKGNPKLVGAYCHENRVRDNVITYLGDAGESGVATKDLEWKSNTFDGNQYHFPPGSPTKRFNWGNAHLTFDQFRQQGQEAAGSVGNTVKPLQWDWKRSKPGVIDEK